MINFELIAHLFPKEKADSLRGKLKGKAPGPAEAIKHLIDLGLVVATPDGYVLSDPPQKLTFACSTFCAHHTSNKGWCSGKTKNGVAVPTGVDWKTWINPAWDGEGMHPDVGSGKSPWTLTNGLPACDNYKPPHPKEQ